MATGITIYPSRRARRFRRPYRILATCLAAAVVAGAAGIWVAGATGKPTILIRVEGRQVRVGEGTALGEAAHRLGLASRAGDLLDVEGRVLRSGVFPGPLLVNGRPAPADSPLHAGDRLGIRRGVDRTERLVRTVEPASIEHPANPQFVVDRILGRSIVVRGSASRKLVSARFVPDRAPFPDRAVALTFDDGPSMYTARILAVLSRLRVPATFFVVGAEAEIHPELVRQEVDAGMAVGNHTYRHPERPPFARLGRERIGWEIDRGRAVLERLGVPSVLFRPPGGSYSSSVTRAAAARGERVVLWSVDARDWVAGTTADQIVRRVLTSVRAGSIIVLHDGGGDRAATLQALPAIIAGIRERDLRFVALGPTG